MERTFRAEKMLSRIKKEGRESLLDDECRELIQKLDGKVGSDYNYRSFVYDDPVVWIPADEEQSGTYVALCDCD